MTNQEIRTMTIPGKNVPRVLIMDQVSPAMLSLLQQEFTDSFQLVKAVPGETATQAKECDFILTISQVVSEDIITAGNRLKLIHKWGVGFDKIDLDAARTQGVLVARATGVNSVAVAEATIMMILALYRQLLKADGGVRNGTWPKWDLRLNNYELRGKKVAIIGFGAIGRAVAQRLKGFETEVYYYDPIAASPDDEKRLGVRGCLGIDELLPLCDIFCLHCNLTEENREFMNAEMFSAMKSSAMLINMARGPLVNEDDLYHALKEGKIAAAGLDVFNKEPVDPDNPLLKLPNVILMPHVASATIDTVKLMARQIRENMGRVRDGKAVDPHFLVK